MKLRNLFMAVVAGAAMLVGCNKEVDLGPAKLALDQTTLAFEAAGGSQTVSVTATRDWAVSGVPDWVALSATSGKAAVEAQPVKITVAQNAEYNRSATIVFTIGFARTSLTINQAGPEGEIDNGDGTLENPFNVAGVLEYTRSLPADQASENNVFFQGKISKVTTTFEASGTYGNATFDVVDEDGGESFYVYQTYYLGNRKWKSGDTDVKEGDEVIICGKVVNFKGNTPETVSKGGSFIYSLNGKSEGGAPGDDDYTKAEAKTVAEFIQLADETKYYKLTGKVSKFNKTYCSFDLTDDSGTIYVFSVLDAYKTDEWKNKIKNGGTITIAGKYEYYAAKEQHEVVNAALLEYTDGEGGGDDYSTAEAKTVAEFITAADENTYYKLTGTVGGSINTTYGNFDLTDASGTIFVYGTQNWSEWKDKVKNGSTVTLAAKYKLYKKEGQPDKDEAVDAYILSCEGGDEPGGGDEPAGDVITATVAEFNAAAESETQKYKLTGTIGGSINTTYGNFDLTDETGTVYVYGLTATDLGYGAKNDKSYASLNLAEGDKITIIGYRGSYGDKIEVLNAYFVEKVTGGDEPGGGDEPAGDVITATVAEFNAAAESETQKYKLTGTIGGSINTTYGNFDLTDETGTVYVYGLTATDLGYGAKNDKSYASLNLAEGDKITIIGYRGSYGDKIEVLNAYFVEKVTGGDEPGGGDEPAGDVITATVAEFNAAAESETQKYQLTGTIGGSINTTYGNFDLTDETGTVYVYGLTATDLGYGAKNDKSYASLNLAEGDKITIIGYRGSYGDKIEVLNAYFVEKVSGGDEPGGGDQPGGIITATIAEFNAAAESETQKYQLTGTIGGSINTTYGNFDLTDETGTVYVYGLTATDLGYGAKNDKSYASLNLAEGDKITIIGYRGSYGDKIEVLNAYFVEKVSGGDEPGGGDQPGGGDEPGGDGNNVSFDKSQLAAAADNGATVAMNDVISFTNSSNYNGTAVTELRIYKSQTFTVSAASGYVVTKIEFTCTASGTTKQGPGCWGAGAPAGYSYDDKDGVWEGSSNSVAFTATDNQVRITSLTVTYAAE